MEDCEAQEGEPQEELASRETINTPAVTATHTQVKSNIVILIKIMNY